MPLIEVTLIEGRSDELKTKLISELTAAAHRAIGAPKPSIRVILREVPASHWGVGGISKAEIDRQKSG
jgi:4-oxalocrotonate tautomerase